MPYSMIRIDVMMGNYVVLSVMTKMFALVPFIMPVPVVMPVMSAVIVIPAVTFSVAMPTTRRNGISRHHQ